MSPERGPPRILAVVVPALPLQRVLRTRPPAGALAVVSEGAVCHANAPALAAGVRPGDSLVQARAACAGLEAVPHDAAADRAALRALAEALLSLSPVVELAHPDAVLLDANGACLAGSDPEAAERSLAERALGVCRDMGFHGQLAVADGKGVALALARHAGRERTRAAPGDGARALAPLPLEALDLPAEVARWLSAVGVEQVGALAALPAETLAHRFGAPGAAAARLARGADPRPLVPFTPETFPHERWDLDGEVGVLTSAEPVLFAAKRLADRVAARLAGRGLGASRLRLTLFLDHAARSGSTCRWPGRAPTRASGSRRCGSGSPGCGSPRRFAPSTSRWSRRPRSRPSSSPWATGPRWRARSTWRCRASRPGWGNAPSSRPSRPTGTGRRRPTGRPPSAAA
jgi:protein ImuB